MINNNWMHSTWFMRRVDDEENYIPDIYATASHCQIHMIYSYYY